MNGRGRIEPIGSIYEHIATQSLPAPMTRATFIPSAAASLAVSGAAGGVRPFGDGETGRSGAPLGHVDFVGGRMLCVCWALASSKSRRVLRDRGPSTSGQFGEMPQQR